MANSNFDKFPSLKVDGDVVVGWSAIATKLKEHVSKLNKSQVIVAVETYQGVLNDELIEGFGLLSPNKFVNTQGCLKSEDEIRSLTYPDVTDDEIFGYMTRLSMVDFFDTEKVKLEQSLLINMPGLTVVYGYGASLICPNADVLVYADMARWEIQLRMRKGLVNGIGVNNSAERFCYQYKRGFFVDWRVCDKLKKAAFSTAQFWLDTNKPGQPKMIEANALHAALQKAVTTPFRLAPFFDPGPWGGQWMKEVCGLDKNTPNFAWCFDCVPEENSLLLNFNGTIVEIPSINLVFTQATKLLGEPVESRFGQEFPIRFDFLDTMEGGNLSLQVHPTTQYIQDKFGMKYTQDESYYMLDASDDAVVYLGVKKNIAREAMIDDLRHSQATGERFDADKYINQFPVKKHDHILIPNGTIHCSGTNGMVLEISSTPYIFTFKLWDWERLGLDGKPRPINVEHGKNVISWERDTEYCQANLINQVEEVASGNGWREERTGLHKNEFIETRRHWFTGTVTHHTGDSVNVINLVEGREAIVESPTNAFEPFVIHYAETFVVPASVGEYTIRPYGESEGKQCATLKAYVRFKQ